MNLEEVGVLYHYKYIQSMKKKLIGIVQQLSRIRFVIFGVIDLKNIKCEMKEKMSKLTHPTLPHYLTVVPILNDKVCIKYTK